MNVPLPCGRVALLLTTSYQRLQRLGVTDQLVWNANGGGDRGYVRCGYSDAYGNLMTPARFIAGAGKGWIVRYRDGNSLNLRDDNLRLVQGRAFGREQARLAA